jgi:hypothetical protein
MTAYDALLDALRDHGSLVKTNGSRHAQAQCPSHDDTDPSLSVTGTEGRTLLYCHAGCDTADVLAALGLGWRDLYNEPRGDTWATYTYPGGRRVHRKPDKSFPQSFGDKTTTDRTLYHGDRIGDAPLVFVVEGEEDVHAVEAAGGVAVSSAMGAGKAHKADWTPLTGRHVVIVADKDQPGRRHAAQVATLCHDIAASVSIVEAAVGKDASDHIAAGKTLGDFVPISIDDSADADTSDTGADMPYTDLLLTRSALRDLPDPEPLIDNVLDQGTVALLYGKWGTGKSFIAQDWGASVATGRPWQGRRTEARRVLYIAAEGAHGIKGRLDAWETGWHSQIDDGTFDILPVPVNLARGNQVANLAALIGAGGYGFVILDTLARCMVGADENSARDCGMVVDVLHRLRQHTPHGRGVILAVHHTGKDGKTFRGSTTFEAGADTVYAVTLDGAVIVGDRQKRKDGPVGDRHELKLTPLDGTGSCIVESSHLGSETTDRAATLLSHFVSHFADIGATRAELRDSIDMPRATFYRALNDLVRSGQLVNEGTSKRPFYQTASK